MLDDTTLKALALGLLLYLGARWLASDNHKANGEG